MRTLHAILAYIFQGTVILALYTSALNAKVVFGSVADQHKRHLHVQGITRVLGKVVVRLGEASATNHNVTFEGASVHQLHPLARNHLCHLPTPKFQALVPSLLVSEVRLKISW